MHTDADSPIREVIREMENEALALRYDCIGRDIADPHRIAREQLAEALADWARRIEEAL